MRAKIAKYSSLSRHPPATDGLPFLSHNPPTIQANGNIMSLSLQEFGHLQIPLEDVVSATNNFSDANILEEGGLERLYKGQLLRAGQLVDIVARRLDPMGGKGEMEMFMEISLLSSLKHNNVVSVLGFCNENNEKIIIYEHVVHRSVDQHLSDPNLTWSQRLQICLGVARALNYIHCKDVIHCDISRSKILIDKDMEAKVFGFGLSTKYPGNWGHRLLFSYYLETSTYKDPMYIKTRSVTPKYDVYAFGVFLYEALCGRKPMMIGYNGLKEKLDDMIDPDLRKQIDTQSLTMFTKTAYNCLIQQHMQRPTMVQVVKELEDALERQRKPETLEQSTHADQTTSSNTLKIENIERLEIRLSDIRSATNNFDKGSCIGSGGYGMVYKAELDHLDIQSMSLLEGKNKNKILKKRSTVAIKRIFNNEGEQGKEGFLAEIETLTSCNHPNIVSLLGFASEDREMILVFEFASRGSLDNCLENNKMFNVTWAQRLQICIDIAQGLNYLHSTLEGKPKIVHRDVKSANVLVDEKWKAKVADFGLSKFHPANQQASTIHTIHIVGTEVYVDPEYSSTFTYKKESDIYSYGVVLFEILSGKLAYDSIYNVGDDVGLASVARRRFKEGTLKELIDPNMLDEADEHILTVNKGPNQESLDTFLKIAHQCVAETQSKRPPMEVVIKELQNALNVQGKASVLMKFRLSDIKSATKNFADKYCVGVGAYGMMYNAKLDHFDRKSLSEIEGKNAGELPKKRTNVALKRIFNREDEHGKQGLYAEIEMLASCEHPNIVSHLGICSEDREMILVYEDGFKGSLHDFLGNNYKLASLTWVQRIQICLDIAHGLTYLNTNIDDKQRIMHFYMNSANILLTVNWRARIACFWLSYNTYNSVATKVQLDPEYIKIGKLKRESGIYSLGIILFEILCGRLEYDETYYVENEKGLPTIARRRFDEGTLNEIIDPILKEETDENIFALNKEVNQHSLEAFSKIAYRCLAETQANRPSTEVVIKELQNALNFQMEYLEQLKIQDVQKKGNLEHMKIQLSDILKATNNFSKTYVIGSGGYGVVYKAELDHFDGINSEGKNKGKRHSTVAIKRIYGGAGEQGEVGFFAEIETLSNCKHTNIVSLIGFCDEGSEMILIYEYVSNKSLDDYLGNVDNMNSFTWAQRIQICLDIAHGLAYLHSSTEDKQMIIHRDIKSQNILLDDNWMAKISDFGLSKLHVANQKASTLNTMNIAGTKVYVDPEYVMTGRLKKESDIYSFGVVLFEIMCGRLAYDRIYLELEEDGLASVARRCFNDGTLKELIDPKLTENDNVFMLNRGLSQDSIDTFSKIAYQCVAETQAERPSMEVIIQELRKALYFQFCKSVNLIGQGQYWS